MKNISLVIFLGFIFLVAGCPSGDERCPHEPETCNGVDDDCDGDVDEDDNGGPLRQDCESSCGVGTQECDDGKWQQCSSGRPVPETCNNYDDDCDGITDEGCDCVHGTFKPCGEDQARGACGPGVVYCNEGVWGECQLPYDPASLVEICQDGIDNDCDGDVDEECLCTAGMTQACGLDQGECQPGVSTCGENSVWGECVGAIEATPEICDELDNDCDGAVDESTAIQFGWTNDRFEPNNLCDQASPLEHLRVRRNQTLVAKDDGLPDDSPMSYPALYPKGEEDWFTGKVESASDICMPWPFTERSNLTVRFELQLVDAVYGENLTQPPEDYQMCVAFGDCFAAIDPRNMECTHGTDWNAQTNTYTLVREWSGNCGDGTDYKIRIVSPNEQACGHYRLRVTLE